MEINHQPCALLFFGLPRSFETLVLPSILQNVIEPNDQCDVYAHSIIRTEEAPGRSGEGGTIDPNSMNLLKERVYELLGNARNVVVETDSEENFWQTQQRTILKYETTTNANGKLVYVPEEYKDPNTLVNMVRQWHSIQSVWTLMEKESKILGVNYTRVAMLRSDVLFATPIHIYEHNKTHTDYSMKDVVLPGFAMYPVNDRMIYGTYDSVKIWATERFSRIDEHVKRVKVGMHSETFLNDSILPAIRQQGTKIVTNPDICFYRVRADMSVWISDCDRARSTPRNQGDIHDKKSVVERIVGRPSNLIQRGHYQYLEFGS
jgi:hypothetical protein